MKSFILLFWVVLGSNSVAAASSEAAQRTRNLELSRQPIRSCQPGNPSAENLFACCVAQAKKLVIQQADVNSLLLQADPQLCAEPQLRKLEFTFRLQASNGLFVYDLKSPRIQDTPFFSRRGLPTTFWLNLAAISELPNSDYGEQFIPFASGAIGVDERETWGLENRLFGSDYSSLLGWRLSAEKILSEVQQNSACPPAKSPCVYNVQTIEQTWLNTETGAARTKIIERWRSSAVVSISTVNRYKLAGGACCSWGPIPGCFKSC